MADDTGRLTSSIADKEAQLETEKNAQRAQEIKNDIHGLQVEVQDQIAKDLGEESPA